MLGQELASSRVACAFHSAIPSVVRTAAPGYQYAFYLAFREVLGFSYQSAVPIRAILHSLLCVLRDESLQDSGIKASAVRVKILVGNAL